MRHRARHTLIALAALLAGSLALTGPATAAFPGEDGLIAVWGTVGDKCCPSNPGIWTVDPDTEDRERITRRGFSPSYSANGRRIAFCRQRGLMRMRANGNGTKRLLRKGCNNAAFSPNGRRIAFTRGGELLSVRASDGSHRKLIFSGRGKALSASWAPDGRLVAFDLRHDGRTSIYVIRPDGDGKRRLQGQSSTTNWRNPDWAPDGSRLAFDNVRNIFTIEPNGSDRVAVAQSDSEHHFTFPAYSPTGAEIAFNSILETSDLPSSVASLATVPSGGGAVEILVETGADWLEPSWQPR